MKNDKPIPPCPLLDSKPVLPRYVSQLSPEMIDRLKQHFWCDFSDVIPAMKWDDDHQH